MKSKAMKKMNTGIRRNVLLRTNLLVCAVIMIGFTVTTLVGYHANQELFRKDTESVTTLTSQGIYHEIDTIFTKPINISLTMGNDSLLKEFLEGEQTHLDDQEFLETMRGYLNTYQEKYNYDSIFLASVKTKRYYNFNGLDRTLMENDPENIWFYDFLKQSSEYTINIDNDQVEGAGNQVTVFINCRIKGSDGETMGIVGVGFRVDSMQSLLRGYEDNFGVKGVLVDENGNVEIDTNHTGYEGNVNFFDSCAYPELRDQILHGTKESRTFWYKSPAGSGYAVSRYVPNLHWYLIVEYETTALDQYLADRLRREIMVLALVIIIVLIAITSVIHRYNAKIIELTVSLEQKHRTVYQEVAEQLYENIYEIDVTHNRAADEATTRYFESLGAPPNIPFDQALGIIAQKQIKEEYRQGYLDVFSPKNVLQAYEAGTENLRYDFMITNDSETYYWMRITAHLFRWGEDNSVRMLVYRENIDLQKQQELHWFDQMQKDSLTGLLNKVATQERIRERLEEEPEINHAFFILDIDNFKEANDRLGHAAGDAVLIEFAKTLKSEFRDDDIVGRIGGDEFVAFIPMPDEQTVECKTEMLAGALRQSVHADEGVWHITASIGVALSPRDGTEFEHLYKKADFALYETKKRGKSGFTIYHEPGGN